MEHRPLPSRALVAILLLLAAALPAVAGATPFAVAAGAAATGTTGAKAGNGASATWPFSLLDVPADRPTGDGVTVAVVDSGIDAGHPAFAGRIRATVDCVGADGSADRCRRGGADDNGHGTHIAGIVAAAPRSAGDGPEGIAPGVELLSVRSLSNTCDGKGDDRECRALGELGDVVAGVRWAITHGADVVNLSIDAGVDLDWRRGELAAAIRSAWARGIVVVASAGNRSVKVDDPALRDVPLVLVGALDTSGERAAYTNLPTTAQWALMAPGGEAGGRCPAGAIRSTYPRTLVAAGEGCLAGTSMAAAYVSGSLASLMSTGIDAEQALAHLLSTAAPSQKGLPATVDLRAALEATPTATVPLGATAAASGDAVPAAAEDAGPVSRLGSALSTMSATAERHPMRVRGLATALLLWIAFAAYWWSERRGSSTRQMRSLTSSTVPTPSTR
ncbi:MAG TPA: S8 family serine peptidase [Acidimicrobiales bacterium]